MPVYEFKCLKCEKEFEISVGFGQVVIGEVTCPDCKSKKIKKKISNPSIIYRGSGWGKDKKNE